MEVTNFTLRFPMVSCNSSPDFNLSHIFHIIDILDWKTNTVMHDRKTKKPYGLKITAM